MASEISTGSRTTGKPVEFSKKESQSQPQSRQISTVQKCDRLKPPSRKRENDKPHKYRPTSDPVFNAISKADRAIREEEVMARNNPAASPKEIGSVDQKQQVQRPEEKVQNSLVDDWWATKLRLKGAALPSIVVTAPKES